MAPSPQTLTAMIAAIPDPVRHAAMLLLASLFSWAVSSQPAGSFLAGAGTYALAWLTPLVTSYGVGSTKSEQATTK